MFVCISHRPTPLLLSLTLTLFLTHPPLYYELSVSHSSTGSLIKTWVDLSPAPLEIHHHLQAFEALIVKAFEASISLIMISLNDWIDDSMMDFCYFFCL